MKTRLYKSHMRGALLWYTNALSEKFLDKLMTPHMIEQMEFYLKQLQDYQQRHENNPVWSVPVKITAFPEQNRIEVDVADDSNLLYLDFDA